MRKPLLLLTSMLIAGFGVNAQFTENTVPEINDGINLYAIDTLAPSYDEINGQDVEWDYSEFGGLPTAGGDFDTRSVVMFEASSSAFSLDFPNSSHALEIENFITYYTSVTEDDETVNGYVFSEPSVGDVVIKFDDPGAKIYEFPFDYGDDLTSTYTGATEVMSFPVTLTGELTAGVDAIGTLKLAQNEYENVYRYKLVETGEIPEPFPGIGDMELNRVQYEYYDFATSKFPIFIYSSVTIGQPGGAPMIEVFTVLSYDEPTFNLSISQEELSNVKVYPNPANDVINVKLPYENANVDVSVVDVAGRTVYSVNSNAAVETIDVSNFNKGVYFVKVSSNENSITQKVIVQ